MENKIHTPSPHAFPNVNENMPAAERKAPVKAKTSNENVPEDLDSRLALVEPAKFRPWIKAEVMVIRSQMSEEFAQSIAIDSLILMVMLARGQSMENLVREQAAKIQIANQRLEALGRIRAMLASYGNEPNKSPNDTINLNQPGSTLAEMKEIAKAAKLEINWQEFGFMSEAQAKQMADNMFKFTEMRAITQQQKEAIEKEKKQMVVNLMASPAITRGNLAKLVAALDSQSQSITNLQTMEMTKLQDYSQKMNQAYELASNFLKKVSDNKSGVTANIR